jgi:hypothetical protein
MCLFIQVHPKPRETTNSQKCSYDTPNTSTAVKEEEKDEEEKEEEKFKSVAHVSCVLIFLICNKSINCQCQKLFTLDYF